MSSKFWTRPLKFDVIFKLTLTLRPLRAKFEVQLLPALQNLEKPKFGRKEPNFVGELKILNPTFEIWRNFQTYSYLTAQLYLFVKLYLQNLEDPKFSRKEPNFVGELKILNPTFEIWRNFQTYSYLTAHLYSTDKSQIWTSTSSCRT